MHPSELPAGVGEQRSRVRHVPRGAGALEGGAHRREALRAEVHTAALQVVGHALDGVTITVTHRLSKLGQTVAAVRDEEGDELAHGVVT